MIYESKKLWGDDNAAYYTMFLHGNTKDGPVKRPAMIVCPGGGYVNHTGWETEPVAHYFLGKGFQVFLLYYNIGPDGNAAFPKPVYDLAKMVMTVRENAAEYNIDPDRIASVGFSAGANLSAALATMWEEPWLSEHLKTTPDMIKLNGTILGYGVYDNLYGKELIEKDPTIDLPLPGRDYTIRDIHNRYYEACIGDVINEDTLKNSSPYYHMTANMPPVFLWHTFSDPIAATGHTLRFASKMYDLGNSFEMHIYQEGLHGMSLADQASDAWYTGVEKISGEDVAAWKELACKFLYRNWNKH